jgi:hypothetical protein
VRGGEGGTKDEEKDRYREDVEDEEEKKIKGSNDRKEEEK